MQEAKITVPVNSFEDHVWQDILTSEMIKIYEPYQRKTYVGENPALLIIDLYRRAYEGGPLPVLELQNTYPSSCGEFAWNAIPPTQEMIALAREQGMPIIYVTRESRKEALNLISTHRKLNEEEQAKDFAIQEEVRPEPGDLVVYKQRATAFFGTPLAAQLKILNVSSLIVIGESTSGCVRATVLDSHNYGYHTVIVEECVFDRCLLSHKVNLFDMHHKYADVMHLAEVKAHFAGKNSK